MPGEGEAVEGAGVAPDGEDPTVDGGYDDVVLSWWQHPLNLVAVILAVTLLAAFAGWQIGDIGDDADGSAVDVGFLRDMRAHHEQAVQMSYQFLDLEGTDPALRAEARNIATGQGLEVGRMIQLLHGFGAARCPTRTQRWAGWGCRRRWRRCRGWRPRRNSPSWARPPARRRTAGSWS